MEIKITIWKKGKNFLESQFEIESSQDFKMIKADIEYNMKRQDDKTPFVINPDSENSIVIDSALLKKSVITIQLIK
jgi:hypothetical protein